jgi:hypothetical protein
MTRGPVVITLFALLVTGCAVNRVAQVDPNTRETIGYAATAHYPGNPQWRPDKVQAAAVDDHKNEQLQVLNLSDNAIPTPTIWVNGQFVRRVETIGPRGSTTISYPGLLAAGNTAMDFHRAGQRVSKVEIQTADGLFQCQGPSRRSE